MAEARERGRRKGTPHRTPAITCRLDVTIAPKRKITSIRNRGSPPLARLPFPDHQFLLLSSRETKAALLQPIDDALTQHMKRLFVVIFEFILPYNQQNDSSHLDAATSLSGHPIQVASQQGTYLARLFSRGFEFSATVPQKNTDNEGVEAAAGGSAASYDGSDTRGEDGGEKVPLSEKLGLSIVKGKFAKPFQFLNLGILAYTGAGGALAQVQVRQGGTAVVYAIICCK